MLDPYSDLDNEWDQFMNNSDIDISNTVNKQADTNNEEIIPKCSDIYISTKTKIVYLDTCIDLKQIFWLINIIPYGAMKEGVIKKQMKFNSTTETEVEELVKKTNEYEYVTTNIIQQINNPNGRIKFKDVRKINIGLGKKDLLTYRTKPKSAFYNCFVLLIRILCEDISQYKEFHVKIFNTGKLEIPGIQNDNYLKKLLDTLISILNDAGLSDIHYNNSKGETVLINSNFDCNFYINRDKLFDILKYKYKLQSIYDPCAYPGIQNKIFFNYEGEVHPEISSFISTADIHTISFMIFRTGSILIVGKCDDENLYNVYRFLKKLLQDEYINIKENSSNYEKKVPPVKKVKKKTILLSN